MRFQRYSPGFLFSFCILVGFFIWVLPRPAGVDPLAWRLFAIFIATILGVILKPYPMGAISVFSLTTAIGTGTIPLKDACLGFGSEIVWLIVFAFFIARGFISTGLGNRVAYRVMSVLGKNSLGLGYGIVATDLILAPCIPSLTARSGAVIYPILKSLVGVFSGKAYDPKMAAFLTMVAAQGAPVTSAMFLTAMAGNPLMVHLAKEQGISISWMSWAIAAFIPGIVTLLILPLLLYKLAPPSIRYTPHAREMARNRLRAMGAMTKQEKIMAATFFLLLILWAFGHFIGLQATFGAMVGVSILLITGILRWKDILEEYNAWDTLIWFSTLVILAYHLNKYGFSSWFSQFVVGHVHHFNWMWAFLLLSLIYFYSHYFFASAVAHIGAMFAPFLIVSIALGTPPLLAAFLLAFFSNLYGGLTHYGSGAAPILFGTGYVNVSHWWKISAICSFFVIPIWVIIGGIWWKVLGIW